MADYASRSRALKDEAEEALRVIDRRHPDHPCLIHQYGQHGEDLLCLCPTRDVDAALRIIDELIVIAENLIDAYEQATDEREDR